MEGTLENIVRDYKIEPTFRKRYVIHSYDDPTLPPTAKCQRESWKSAKEPIGRGGQGQVFLQTCKNGIRKGSRRVVKIIKHQDADENRHRRRHLRELVTIVRFSHAKGDLYTYLRQNPSLPEKQSPQIASQVLQALAIMHGEGFAHRDIKPQKVLIQQHPALEQLDWWIKLADFGISKRVDTTIVTKTTGMVGTEEYMAAELFQRKGDVDSQQADMWALGVMVFFILTGSRLFRTCWDTFEYTRSPDRLFPRGSLDDCKVSEDGQDFIRSLLHIKPEERPTSRQASTHSWVRAWMPTGARPTPEYPNDDDNDLSDILSTSSEDQSVSEDEVGLTTVLSSMDTQPEEAARDDDSHLMEHAQPRGMFEVAKALWRAIMAKYEPKLKQQQMREDRTGNERRGVEQFTWVDKMVWDLAYVLYTKELKFATQLKYTTPKYHK